MGLPGFISQKSMCNKKSAVNLFRSADVYYLLQGLSGVHTVGRALQML